MGELRVGYPQASTPGHATQFCVLGMPGVGELVESPDQKTHLVIHYAIYLPAT